MDNALLTAGAACLIGALVGGGLKAFGIELPVIQSRMRQGGLAVVGIVLIVLARPSLPALPGSVATPSSPAQAASANAPTAAAVNVSTAIPAAVSTPTALAPRAPSAASIPMGGAPVSVRSSGPGQHTRLAFDARSNQAVSILVRDPSTQQASDTSLGCDGAVLQLLAPGEQSLASGRRCTPILGIHLPVDGTYVIDLSTDEQLPVDFAVQLFDASPQVGQISAGGPPVPIRTLAPGQHVRLTFAGQANQVVTVTVRDPGLLSPGDTSLGCDGARVDLLAPGGQSIGGIRRCSPLPSKRLSVDGMYTVDFSTDQELPSDFVIQLFSS